MATGQSKTTGGTPSSVNFGTIGACAAVSQAVCVRQIQLDPRCSKEKPNCQISQDAAAKMYLFGRRGDMLQDLAAEAGAVSNDRGVNVAVLVLRAIAAGAD